MSSGVHLLFLFPGNFSLIFERKRAKKTFDDRTENESSIYNVAVLKTGIINAFHHFLQWAVCIRIHNKVK